VHISDRLCIGGARGNNEKISILSFLLSYETKTPLKLKLSFKKLKLNKNL
jgi:hypothetical protein